MNVSSARNRFSRQTILSGLAGLILMAAPIMVTAAAADPYDPPNDVAAYQAYTAQNEQYGQPMPPPPGQYPGGPNYAQRHQLEVQLNYAERQYNQARQAGNEPAAKHWKREIKHLRRELSGGGHAEGPGYGAPAYMQPQGPPYPPPASAYAPPASAYASPMQEYAPSGSGYAQPYPSAAYPPSGYPNAGVPGYAQPYPAAEYPPSSYPNGAAASPYGAPGATGSGGLSSLLGPLFGGGSAPSAAPYPQAGYPNAAAGSPYGTPTSTGAMGGLGSLLGPLFGARSAP